MAVLKDDSGRREIQVEVEVPGTPEEVWEAIATARGVSSWFVPTTTEWGADGKPLRMTSNFGPGMDSVATITDWNPPHSLSAESHDLGEGAPPIATQWIVEARDGGTCIVRVVHSLFTSKDDWDDQLEGWEKGWPDFFRLLHLYLSHFPGREGALVQLAGFASSSRETAWSTLVDALGLGGARAGEHRRSSDAAPVLGGVVEHAGRPSHAEELVLRMDAPEPGIAHLFAMEMGEQVMLSVRFYLYGETGPEERSRHEQAWQSWLAERFPATPG